MQADDLLRHGAFLRNLAASLLHGDADAEDVVQDAYVKALTHGKDVPRAWFATVVRNLVRRVHRTRARTERRERAAARPDAHRPVDPVERLEIQREIVEAVLGLEEPYRSTVVLRYFDELPPREIARRTGVPYETVRTRLVRALKELRRRLDSGHSGWAPTAAAFVVRPPKDTLMGGLLMSAQKKVVLVCLPLFGFVAGMAGHAVLATPAPGAPARAASRTAGLTVQYAQLEQENEILREELDRARANAPAQDRAAKAGSPARPKIDLKDMVRFSGRVVDESGRVMPGVQVLAAGRDMRVDVVSGADGTFTLHVQPDRGPWTLGFAQWSPWEKQSRLVTAIPDAAPGSGLELKFQGITGRILDAADQPVREGIILAVPAGKEDASGYGEVLNGAFTIAGLDPGRYRLRYKTGISGSEWCAIEGGDEVPVTTADVVLRLIPGAAIEGIVLDEQGRPRQGVWVRATAGEKLTGASTDANGRFRIEGLAPGASYRLTAWITGFVPETREIPSRASDVRFQLDPGWTTTGQLLDAQGKPVPGASLRIRPESGMALPLYPKTDGSGRFELAGLPREPIRIEAGGGNWTVRPGDTDVALRVDR